MLRQNSRVWEIPLSHLLPGKVGVKRSCAPLSERSRIKHSHHITYPKNRESHPRMLLLQKSFSFKTVFSAWTLELNSFLLRVDECRKVLELLTVPEFHLFLTLSKISVQWENKVSNNRHADGAKKMEIITVSLSNSLILIYSWSLCTRIKEKTNKQTKIKLF